MPYGSQRAVAPPTPPPLHHPATFSFSVRSVEIVDAEELEDQAAEDEVRKRSVVFVSISEVARWPAGSVCFVVEAHLSGDVPGNSLLLRGSVCMRRETVGCCQHNWSRGAAERRGRRHTGQDELADGGDEAGEEGIVRLWKVGFGSVSRNVYIKEDTIGRVRSRRGCR